MSPVIHPKNIFIYFDNHLNYAKVKNLHSFFVLFNLLDILLLKLMATAIITDVVVWNGYFVDSY